MKKQLLHVKALVNKDNVSSSGVVEVIGSTPVIDRMGDTIVQEGWDLKNYKENPVILWGHNVEEDRPSIGKALKVWVQGKAEKAQLMFQVQFDMQDSFAAEIFRKVKEGFINTVSVGFMPTEYEEMDEGNFWGGRKYTKQELLELSFVPVPANPQAVVTLRKLSKSDKRFTPMKLTKLYPKVKDDRDTRKKGKAKDDQVDLSEMGNPVEDLQALGSNIIDCAKKMGDAMDSNDQDMMEGLVNEVDASADTMDDIVDTMMDTLGMDLSQEDNDDNSEDNIDDRAYNGLQKLKALKMAFQVVAKQGRTISAENEDKINQAIDLLNDVLGSIDQDPDADEDTDNPAGQGDDDIGDDIDNNGIGGDTYQDEDSTMSNHGGITKGIIPYTDHGIAPEATAWDGQGEVVKASVEDLKVMCAWFDSANPDVKASYKLPHHRQEDYKAVWGGVAAAMAALMGARGGVAIPDGDRQGVYNHLVKHYNEFGKTPPDFKMVQGQVMKTLSKELDAIQVQHERKYEVRLIKRVLDVVKGTNKVKQVQVEKETQLIQSLRLLDKALSLAGKTTTEGGEK